MDNEREPELSEETLRLVRELGEQLEDGAPGPRAQLDARLAWPVELNPEEQERIESLRRELEIAGRQMAELSDRYARLRAELRRLESDRVGGRLEFAAMAEPRRWYGRGGGSLPDYLDSAERDILMGDSGAYWLHGENARERARAVDALAGRLAQGGKLGWVTAVVNLAAAPGRDRLGNDLVIAVRQVWDTMDEGPDARPTVGMLRAPALRAGSRGRAGVAIILPEFPARHKKAASFLKWLSSGMAMGSVPLLVIVSAESPPEAAVGAGFQAVLCETAAARTGRRIAELRLKRGWNRAELAERMDMPESMIRELEAGLRETWDERILQRVAAALDVSFDDLLSS